MGLLSQPQCEDPRVGRCPPPAPLTHRPRPDARISWALTPKPTTTLPLGDGDLSEPRVPRGLGLEARSSRTPPGGQRPGAGMGAGRRPPGSALRGGRGGGLEGQPQRLTVAPATSGVPEQAGISRTASPDPQSPGPSAAGRRRGRPRS